MSEPLTATQFRALLDGWVGAYVAVRVVTDRDDLVAVFQGRLCGRSVGKRPSLFWPLHTPDEPRHEEQPGIYLHPDRFQGASAHEGDFVLELRQGDVTLNIRRL